MALYKFTERRHLDSFFRTGQIRLGTIHSFRDTIEYGASRGDAREGKHDVGRRLDGPVTLRAGHNESVLSEILKVDGGGELTVSGDGLFVVERRSEDGFLYCTTHHYSEALFAEWHRRERLDACYEISDVPRFMRAVSTRIASSTWYVGTNAVVYVDAEVDYRSPLAERPWLTKLAAYSWQHEVRSIWAPLYPTPPLRPWIIEVPEAVQFCRPLRPA